MSYTPELRRCRLCNRAQEFVYLDGHYRLFKYGVRHYAHAECLAKEHGTRAARAMLPEHVRKDFDSMLRVAKRNDWTRAHIDVKDKAVARRQGRP